MNMEPTKFGPPPPSYDQSSGPYPGPPGHPGPQPYPQAGFQPQPQVQAGFVQAVGHPVAVGPDSTHMQCPSCHAQISSTVRYDTTTKTHIMAGIICLVGCCLCAWMPYIMDSCKNANHYCPQCDAFIGTYKT